MAKKPKADAPPKTPLRRTKVLGHVATAVAGKKLKSEVQALFLTEDKKEAHRAQTREEIAGLIFEGLSKLRGTALKLAQVFCADTGLLAPEYLRTFEQAHYQVPGLSPALVRSVLRRELGAEPEAVFASIDWSPRGAASLGQVHRATLQDGTAVAIKVQYPGMQESILSDMNLARMALKPVLRTGLILSTLRQLEERLKEEVDYRCELANLEWFREQTFPFALRIPKGYREFSSSRVLTMEWMNGQTVDAWLTTKPSVLQINAVAQTIFDLFIYSVFQRRRFHSDPNLGNFFVQADGEVVLLDFGGVTTLAPEEVVFYQNLWRTEGSSEFLLAEYARRGARIEPGFWEESVQPYQTWIANVTGPGTFDFGRHPNFVVEGYQLFTRQLFNPNLQGYSDQLTLAHRTLLGVFSLFTRMQAEVSTASAKAAIWG